MRQWPAEEIDGYRSSESAGKGGSVVISLSNITLILSLSSHLFDALFFSLTRILTLFFTLFAKTLPSSLIHQLSTKYYILSSSAHLLTSSPLYRSSLSTHLPPLFVSFTSFPLIRPPSVTLSVSLSLFFYPASSVQSIHLYIHPFIQPA